MSHSSPSNVPLPTTKKEVETALSSNVLATLLLRSLSQAKDHIKVLQKAKHHITEQAKDLLHSFQEEKHENYNELVERNRSLSQACETIKDLESKLQSERERERHKVLPNPKVGNYKTHIYSDTSDTSSDSHFSSNSQICHQTRMNLSEDESTDKTM